MLKFRKAGSQILSLETIEFQKDSFAKDIEVCFTKLLDSFKNNNIPININKNVLILEIAETTFKRTGIKVNLVTDSEIAAVLPFFSNNSHIFLDSKFHGKDLGLNDQKKILEATKEFNGYVDTIKCKVSGIFSEYKTNIYINVRQLKLLKFTPGELTAVYLHELGHAFYACEYTNRLNTTNQILASLLRDKLDKKDIPKEYLFKEFKKLSPNTKDVIIDDIISNDKNIILGRNTFLYIKELVESQLKISKYDENSFETLADNFAARWNYGNELVTALEKLTLGGRLTSEQSLIANGILFFSSLIYISLIITIIIKLIMVISANFGLTLYGTLFSSGLIVASLFMAVGLILFLSTYSSKATKMTYDDTVYRYKRIRQQLIIQIKDSELEPEQTKNIIDSIKSLDKILSDKNNYKSLLTIIIDFFTPGANSIEDSIKIQRILEELSANDLYLKAASLRLA